MVRRRSRNQARSSKKKKYPPQVDAAIQRAISLQQRGALNEAESVYHRILAQYPEHPDANHLLGLCSYARNDYQSAIVYISAALKGSPKNAEFMHNLALVYKDSNRLEESKRLLKLAIKVNGGYSSAFNSLGSVYMQEGDFANSIVQFKRAVKLDPGGQDAIYNLSKAYIASKKYHQAIPLLTSLHTLNPDDIDVINSLCDCYYYQGQTERAIDFLTGLYNKSPTNVEIIYRLANINEKSSNLNAAQEWIEKARSLDNKNAEYIYLNAVILRRKKLFDEAARLYGMINMALVDDSLAQKIYFELGSLYDRKAMYDKAFESYARGNALQARAVNKSIADKDRFVSHVQKVTENLKKSWIESWISCDAIIDDRQMIFMVAFPRSGTTLLDQILDGHSHIQVMEEQPILGQIIEKLVAEGSDYPRDLEKLTCKDVQRYRNYYFKEVQKYIDLREGTVFVDKLPLNVIEIELIYRLFPKSKVIISLRHPYDVCLSNFMQQYELNDAMANFLSLEDTAFAYNLVMSLWQKYVSILEIQYHAVKYEDLVEDAEGQAKKIMEFLKLDWEPTVLDHVSHAKKRSINTPSYQQVTEAIYTRSKYRWKHYEEHIEQIKDRLRPQMEYFGYLA